MWRMKDVEVIPVLIGALGAVTKQFKKWIQKLDLEIEVEMLQKPCLLGTARIIRKVLDMKLKLKEKEDHWLCSAIVVHSPRYKTSL